MTKETDYQNFNTAETSDIDQYDLIPAGTIANAVVNIQSGNHGENNYLTKNDRTGSIGLKLEFTLTSSCYQRRKIFQLIGIEGIKKDEFGNDKWGAMGRKFIRAILESAHDIEPFDMSEKAVAIRNLSSFEQLNDLNCLVKIGIEEDKTGQYADKNKIVSVITNNQKEYAQFRVQMSMEEQKGNSTRNHPQEDQNESEDDLNDDIPFF